MFKVPLKIYIVFLLYDINNFKDKHVKIDTILLTKLLGICLDDSIMI